MDQLFGEIAFSEWIFLAIPTLVLVGFAELGFKLGKRARVTSGAGQGSINGIQGAMLALLGLLLGFTFAMAGSRHEARRDLVVKDANAIGTTFLRAALLPAAHAAAVQDLLRQSVALRLEYQPLFDDPVQRAEGLRRNAEVQRQLWSHAVAAAQEAPTAIVATFVTALNDMFDVESERLAASRVHIPAVVWLLILVVASLGCLTSSYVAGIEGSRSPFSSMVLPLLIAVVMTMIFDLMNPSRGMIGISQQPLIDLQRSIAPPPS